ncbi:hypothetical protein P1P75_11950 [Streptomyces sp. ID05-39B]|uniref:hypothetical protein n=1 Tax=Streptomyces sp. ID05-39B TaxID=3028664 RepID=UPI0029B6C1D1|nr:hypothetical protein [Streptomyces sp. ID05-39B]MDX3527136.1 hypothetical protein [Streptomyces sp. ID05-39B]
MSQWNLSVRLTGQGSGLSRTLRDLSRDADRASTRVNALRRDIDRLRTDARNSIRIRLDVDAAHLRSDVRAALTSAGAGQDLRVRLGVDAAHLRSDVRAALTSAGAGQALRVRLDVDAAHLRSDVRAALSTAGAGQGMAVNLRLGNAMQLRREVEAAVRWAAWGHRIEIPIGLGDPMQLRRDVTAAVRWASMTQTIRIRVEPDTSALTTLGGTRGGSSGGGGGAFGLGTLIPLASAAIPLMAGLTAEAGPLAGSLLLAGGAATAFGIALAGQVSGLKEVSDAEKKYRDAVQEHGKASTQAAEAQLAYQRQLAQLPPDTQKAAVALSRLKTTFGDWSDDMSSFTMQPVTKGFTVLEQLIPRLSPQVQSFSGELDRLMNVAGGAISTPGFDRFADQVARLTDQQLDEFTDDVIHLMRVVSEGRAGDGALGELLDYAQQNGPAAREAIQAIGKAVIVLAQGAAEAGPSMLTLVTAAARLVSALPPELIGIILQVAFALKLLQLSGAGMAALAAGIGRVQVQIAALGATSAAAGGGLMGLRAAFLSLGVAARASIIVAAIAAIVVAAEGLSHIGESTPPDVDKLSTSLGNLGRTGKATGYVAEKFGADFGKLNDQIKKVTNPSVVESINNWGESITGGLLDAGDATEEFTKNADSIDESLSNLVRNGNAKLAAAALADILKGLDPEEAAKLRGELDGYDEVLADLAFEERLTAESMGLFGQAASDTKNKLDAQKQSADGLRQAIVALNDVNRAAGSAMAAFEQSIDDATEATKDHSGALTMRDGELNLGTEKAREAEKVLSDLAANTDAAATAARDQGKSWQQVSAIYTDGRKAFVDAADAMGLTKTQAEALANAYLQIPDSKTTVLEMRTEDAIAGLDSVIAAIQKTPGQKSVTVSALTADAVALLEDLGFTVTHLKDGRFSVTAHTATAKERLASVQAARDGLKDKAISLSVRDQASAQAAAIQRAIDNIRGKTVTITTVQQTLGIEGMAGRNARNLLADGGVLDYYADGGIQRGGIRHFATGSEEHVAQIAPAGSWRVWAEDETQGEGYVPFAPSKRPRSRAITEEIVRRLGGDPAGIQWNANGSITSYAGGGFTYSPTAPAGISGSGSGMDRYNDALQRLTEAVNQFKNATTAAQKASAKRAINSADAALGLRAGTWSTSFNLASYQKFLAQATAANTAWEANLARVGQRAGQDVAETLRGMGTEGTALVAQLAKASTRQFNAIVANLRKLGPTAKATLADYTSQLRASTSVSKAFQDNLLKLASQGYGTLAAQLAGQGDENAMAVAASAVRDSKQAAAANSAVKANAGLMTSDDLANALIVLNVLKGKKGAGIADVIAAGVSYGTLKALLPKILPQVTALPAPNRDTLLRQVAGQGGVTAMARGGILDKPTMVVGGEAGVTESWIPWTDTARSRTLLAQTAAAMGYRLLPAHAVSVTPAHPPWAGGQAPARTVDNRRTQNITLNGAHQSLAEQRADLLRHMTAIG